MRSLICITTCNRVNAIRAIVRDYINFCIDNDQFDFLISADGEDLATIAFCKKKRIPILYSRKREGVGLSKNRVLEAYPDYSYYFFIEDDVILLNPKVFNIHIKISEKSGIPHFSLFKRDRIIGQEAVSRIGAYDILHTSYGGAPFNFFTREGIDVVGGFDTSFAKVRRFGHTEHSYRFVNAGLCKYPFNIIDQCIEGYMEWTEPGTVTKIKVEKTANRLYIGEADLIAKKNKWQPIKTLSEYFIPESLSLKKVHGMELSGVYKSVYIARVRLMDRLRGIKRVAKAKLGLASKGLN